MSKNNCHVLLLWQWRSSRAWELATKLGIYRARNFIIQEALHWSLLFIGIFYVSILDLIYYYSIQIFHLIIIPFKYVYTRRKFTDETDFEFIEEFYHRNFTWTRRDIPYRAPLCAYTPFTWIKTLPLSFIFQRYISTGSERSSRHNRQDLFEQPRGI